MPSRDSEPAVTDSNPLPAAQAWAAARTGARWEKKVRDFFREAGSPTYLPLYEKRRVYGNRIRLSQLPLFAGYVFFDSGSIEPARIQRCGRIAQILQPSDPEELRRDLEQIALALSVQPDLHPARIVAPGTPVEVRHGPLKGLSGVFVRRGGESLLLISVRFLGATAELEIDEALVGTL
jgi:hypothetical protein